MSDPSVRRAAWFVAAAFAALPLVILLTAAVPTGARPAVFLGSVTVVSALALAGGIRARRALLAETPHPGRAAVVAWVGLFVGVVAGVYCLWGAIGLLA